MGEYANVKSKDFYRVLQWLANKKGLVVRTGGNHVIKVESSKSGQSFPLPLSHGTISRYITRSFVEWLVKNEVCTKEEFDERL